MNPGLTSGIYGLIAALTWGAGDFSGGIAAKRTNAYGVVIFAHLFSMLLLLVTVLIVGEPVPPLKSLLWGGAAGLGGGFGLLLLYSALASGRMSVAAPVSALVAAGIPVIVAAITDGWPGMLVVIGFILALASIWFVSGGGSADFHLADLRLPLLAGVAFGFFFISLHQASAESVLYALIAVRVVSISSILIFAAVLRQPILPTRGSLLPILMSGVLDTFGNAFYALAAQQGRVDVAAVLSSLYPGSTVLLARLLLKERISRTQMLGILAALVSIVLITI